MLFALRYSLGRQTYASESVATAIKDNIEKISSDNLKQYVREIRVCESYGMDFDETFWLSFAHYLESEFRSERRQLKSVISILKRRLRKKRGFEMGHNCKKRIQAYNTFWIVVILICATYLGFDYMKSKNFFSPIVIEHTNGPSMTPTILDNEFIRCDTSDKARESLEFLDIIAFQVDEGEGYLNFGEPGEKRFMKRIIGVGGDEIILDRYGTWRNGELLDEPYVNEEDWKLIGDYTLYYKVPENHVFVMGDNRNYSGDSRYKEDPYVNLETQFYCKYIETIEK